MWMQLLFPLIKFMVLKGSGLLALKKFIEVEPILFGGGQESGIRSGTTPVPLAVSTAKAVRMASQNIVGSCRKAPKDDE